MQVGGHGGFVVWSAANWSFVVELRGYLNLARRHIWWLIVVPIFAATGVYFLSRAETPQYVATAQVLLRPNDPSERLGTSSGTSSEINSAASADRYVKAQANIAKSPAVRAAAAREVAGTTEGLVKEALSVTAALDSSILRISAKSSSPDLAQAIANSVSTAYIENRRLAAVAGLERAIKDLDKNLAALSSDIVQLSANTPSTRNDAQLETARSQLQTLSDKRQGLAIDANLKRGESELIETADRPSKPVSPTPVKTSLLAAFAALFLVAGATVLRDRLDVGLRTRQEAEGLTGLTTLAELPVDRELSKGGRDVDAIKGTNALISEAVRSLRVSLRFLALERPLRSILVTSAVPGDGKSTLSINLAASYALAGVRTLLVSADLRRPQVERMANASREEGLVETLSALAMQVEYNESIANSRRTTRRRKTDDAAFDTDLNEFLAVEHQPTPRRVSKPRKVEIIGLARHDIDNLWILPAGQPVASPVEILGSPVMKDFFALALESFDMIIVDSPPVVPVSDSLVLSQFVDGVVFVTSVRKTPRQMLQRGVELLQASSAPLLGLVVNRTPLDNGGYYGGYYGYGHSQTREGKAQKQDA